MRHAWLIIAHNEFEILQRLVSALDAPESSFFIHIDKKVKTLPIIHAEQGEVIFLAERIDVRWGSVSQIKCEFALIEAAASRGSFDFYHILSGTTLPLKPKEELFSLFEKYSGKCLLSGLCKDLPYQETLKVRRYNCFLKNYASTNTVKRTVSQFLWKSAIALQRYLGIETNRGAVFYKASNWLSLSDSAVKYLISKKKQIFKKYRYSFCGDEYFIPSELISSPLNETVNNKICYLLHHIERSNAQTYHLTDFDTLCNSGYWFARKFSAK